MAEYSIYIYWEAQANTFYECSTKQYAEFHDFPPYKGSGITSAFINNSKFLIFSDFFVFFSLLPLSPFISVYLFQQQ